jgi:hypothetical protein
MSKANEAAYPPQAPLNGWGDPDRGLTKLELFSAMAMQGLAANGDTQICMAPSEKVAEWSLSLARALFAELEKQS